MEEKKADDDVEEGQVEVEEDVEEREEEAEDAEESKFTPCKYSRSSAAVGRSFSSFCRHHSITRHSHSGSGPLGTAEHPFSELIKVGERTEAEDTEAKKEEADAEEGEAAKAEAESLVGIGAGRPLSLYTSKFCKCSVSSAKLLTSNGYSWYIRQYTNMPKPHISALLLYLRSLSKNCAHINNGVPTNDSATSSGERIRAVPKSNNLYVMLTPSL